MIHKLMATVVCLNGGSHSEFTESSNSLLCLIALIILTPIFPFPPNPYSRGSHVYSYTALSVPSLLWPLLHSFANDLLHSFQPVVVSQTVSPTM